MVLKTNVVNRDFHFLVTAENRNGDEKYFLRHVQAESENAAVLRLKSYFEADGLKVISCQLECGELKEGAPGAQS